MADHFARGQRQHHHEGERRRADDQRAKRCGVEDHDDHRDRDRSERRKVPFGHSNGEKIANAAVDAGRPNRDQPRLAHQERDREGKDAEQEPPVGELENEIARHILRRDSPNPER